MRTVRHFYFYLVAFISLQVIVWGVISLCQTLVEDLPGGGAIDLLAGGLSLVLVGLPIFFIHWLVVQRDASQNAEERNTQLRALFLYVVLFAALAPVVYALLAILSRVAFDLFGLESSRALVGAGQTLADNLIAIIVNLVVWAYFQRLLQREWQYGVYVRYLRELRRLYRYAWVVYGLALVVSGCQQILTYLFMLAPQQPFGLLEVTLANGLAFSLVGAPLWAYTWNSVQKSLDETGERLSLLRAGFLYLAAVTGCFTTLVATGSILADILGVVLGMVKPLVDLVEENSSTLASIIPFAAIWAYYGRAWRLAVEDEPDALLREGRERFFFYLLSLVGTVTTILGLIRLGSTVIDGLFRLFFSDLFQVALRGDLANALAILAIGLPLWLVPWGKLQAGAHQSGDSGDHARRSLLRKGYLYLILFASVVGAMSAAGWALYLALTQVLGSPTPDFWHEFANRLQIFGWVMVWLVYHWHVLRSDGNRAQQALNQRYVDFPVLVLKEVDDEDFCTSLVDAVRRRLPNLPIQVGEPEMIAREAGKYSPQLVVLPGRLTLNPPEALHQYLATFTGQRLVVPTPTPGWTLLDSPERPVEDLIKETTEAIRQMAEGQGVRPPRKTSPWIIASAILGGFLLLLVLVMLFMGLLSSFN